VQICGIVRAKWLALGGIFALLGAGLMLLVHAEGLSDTA